MRDVTKPDTTALSESFANKLLSGIAESRATTVIGGGGKSFLRLKNGNWIFGQTNEEVQDGSEWVINVMSLGHGYSCWVETGPNTPNELRDEVMISMSEPKPVRPIPIDGTPYKEQRSFEAKCLTGADAGHEVLYKNTSLGGLQAFDDLIVEIQNHLYEPDGKAFPCPVIRLEVTDYPHKKHGQTFVPIFEVMGWADMEGTLQPAGKPVSAPQEPEPAKPAGRGRAAKPALEATARKPSKPPLTAEEEGARAEGPVSTTQAHAGQRRRPAAR